ncbi:5-carboxymethyl-2-hydroxymuconate Delta-isomerase [Opacimonas viscosa]|uniref:5-carboxymethyl-2-hydroxymuconate Delta-isomerase n=1 Tax=Opacimonas viscosa TaxID=2961944 RepID=A0AA42BL88_9ALTE|nr:5-carboxymethyl-2-hydroxymuconate Delta-isomerase [Opacimonas viscosa]MCP3427342.1 5-carboxymethyl-2-hydroxymuconate Delta-isomerase [Opacimonas viscosa]
MPHFIIECTAEIAAEYNEDFLFQELHKVAQATELFNPQDIKVRMNAYPTSTVGGIVNSPFIHVFAHIMSGRTVLQKAELSKAIVHRLTELFPEVPHIAMNVYEFEAASYCKRT